MCIEASWIASIWSSDSSAIGGYGLRTLRNGSCGMAAGPRLLVRSAPRFRLGSVMTPFDRPLSRSDCQKSAPSGRDFICGGTSWTTLSLQRHAMSLFRA
jgi:hypothetical protein